MQDVVPPGVFLQTWGDRSELLEDRKDLLVRNAQLGLLLVLLSLGLFLNRKLAFWVTLGIPISFLGAFLLLPHLRRLDQYDLAIRVHRDTGDCR